MSFCCAFCGKQSSILSIVLLLWYVCVCVCVCVCFGIVLFCLFGVLELLFFLFLVVGFFKQWSERHFNDLNNKFDDCTSFTVFLRLLFFFFFFCGFLVAVVVLVVFVAGIADVVIFIIVAVVVVTITTTIITTTTTTTATTSNNNNNNSNNERISRALFHVKLAQLR